MAPQKRSALLQTVNQGLAMNYSLGDDEAGLIMDTGFSIGGTQLRPSANQNMFDQNLDIGGYSLAYILGKERSQAMKNPPENE